MIESDQDEKGNHMGPMMIPGVIEITEVELWAIAAALVMMLFDVVSGFVGAAVRGDISSTKMREGIGHKAMLILLVVLAIFVQAFTLHIGDMGWTVPLITPVCVYIIVMEVASVVENVIQAYPALRDTPLVKLFERVTGYEDTTDA